ncbi:hypothetical protein PSTT_08588, partial [Puccinia striiformis]
LSTSSAVLYHGDAGLVFTRVVPEAHKIDAWVNLTCPLAFHLLLEPTGLTIIIEKNHQEPICLSKESRKPKSYRPGSSGYVSSKVEKQNPLKTDLQLKGKSQVKSYQPGSSGHVSSKVGQELRKPSIEYQHNFMNMKLDQHVIRVDSVDPVVSSRRNMADRGRAVGRWLWRVYTYNPTFRKCKNQLIADTECT